jgi:ribonuclease HI
MNAQAQPIAYGLKILFEDGTVLNWYRGGRRRTVHAEKNPHGRLFPHSDPTGEGILAAMGEASDPALRRLLGLPAAVVPSKAPPRPVAAFDGGCRPNPGPGGWGVVLPDGRELSGAEPQSTNNRMELTGAIRALEATAGPLHLIGDSSYVVRGASEWLAPWIRRGWTKADGEPVVNADLWRRLARLLQERDVTWQLVRGHSGNVLNERCDRLATEAREKLLRGNGRRRG